MWLPLSSRASASRQRRTRPEDGVTLPELLISMVLVGALIAGLLTTLTIINKSKGSTETRVMEANDIKSLQTYLPQDLSSAIAQDLAATAQPFAGQTLPGTSVLSLTRNEAGATILTNYRYEQRGVKWSLVRYEQGNPINGGALSSVVVVDELVAPPTGWRASQAPNHAAFVHPRTARNTQLVGADLEITFVSGKTFSAGGTALAAGDRLPEFDPAAPLADQVTRSRCGGAITLVLDSSGSIPNQNGVAALTAAAQGFITAFKGTPSSMSIVGFSNSAYPISPAIPGESVDLLRDSAELKALEDSIAAITYGGSTNWEDGLYQAFRAADGTPHLRVPELIVFVTDGDPNTIRNADGSSGWIGDQPDGVVRSTDNAVAVADYGRGLGTRVIGVLVGDTVNNPDSVARLQQVVGTEVWNGQAPGNAETAQYYSPSGGNFAALGEVFRAIMAAECGGTVTVQKFIDDGAGGLVDPSEAWTFESLRGAATLDPSLDDSVTFEFDLSRGRSDGDDHAGNRGLGNWVTIEEISKPGFVLDRVECELGGVPLAASRLERLTGGRVGVRIDANAAEAISCSFISRVG